MWVRWFTADLHLGHHRIVEFEPARPGADVDAMNDALIDNWNDVVAPTDDVWVLGDVAMGTIAGTLPLVGRLHGRLVLVPGNHDRCFAGHPNWQAWTDRYLAAGFTEVRHGPLELALGDQTVTVSHFPYTGESRPGRPDRYAQHRPEDRGQVLLHGHVHSAWRVNGRQINVGVDAWDHRPVAENVVAGLAAAAI